MILGNKQTKYMKKILTLLLITTLTSAVGWGEEYSYTFENKVFSALETKNLGGVDWTLGGRTNDDQTYYGTDNSGRGHQFGSSSHAFYSLLLSTSGISGTIQSVKVNASTASGSDGKLSISVGGISYLSNQVLTTSATDYTGNGSSSGTIVISISQTKIKALYIKSITVVYSATPHKVTGIGELKSLTSGDMVELYLPDGNNARVTHVESKAGGTIDAYVRDNTGAVSMTGISPNRPMAYDQHLAGWITGKYTVGSDGIPQFEPDEDLTNTAFLVIADRVTENETEPVEVASDEISDHLGDWVTVKDVRVGAAGSVGVTNKFVLAYYNSSQLYTGALVDIHGIAASGKLYPVDDKDEYPITHVVDAQENFVSPTESISNTQVRFKRAMSNSNYYLLTVPFEFDDFEGDVFEYTGVSLGQVGTYNYNGSQVSIMGGVMHFEKRYYHTLQPGTPYLVKPSSALTEMTLGGVTLSNAAAGSVKYSLAQQNTAGINLMADEQPAYVGDYTLVGTYSPQVLPKDESTAILDGNTVSWTSVAASTAIDGTEAYVTLPAGAGVKFDVPGNGIVTAISEMSIDNVAPREAVIYNIMGVRMTRPLSELPPGIYIVNGKKIVKF